MSSERAEEYSQSAGPRAAPDDRKPGEDRLHEDQSRNEGAQHDAIVVVRGETVRDEEPRSTPKDVPPKDKAGNDKGSSAQKRVSEAKAKMRDRLPALDDDADVSVQKEQLVTRDGKADLAFTGTLLASAAPPAAAQDRWNEYRIYETNGGKHVFSKITRNVFADQHDSYEAEIFDPSPSSVPSKLLRSARELTHSHPMTWTDAAVAFFGYDPLAKVLYRKLSGRFEEHIS